MQPEWRPCGRRPSWAARCRRVSALIRPRGGGATMNNTVKSRWRRLISPSATLLAIRRKYSTCRAGARRDAGGSRRISRAQLLRLSARGSAVSRRVAQENRAGLAKIRESVSGIAVLIGFPEYVDDTSTTVAPCSQMARCSALPQTSVAELRVFRRGALLHGGKEPRISAQRRRDRPDHLRRRLAAGPIAAARAAGAECVIAINGSPYELGTQQQRERRVRAIASRARFPCFTSIWSAARTNLSLTAVSFVMDASGEFCACGRLRRRSARMC